MTTARDLLFASLDVPADRPVEQGDLSLALAGAELADLLAAGAVTLDDDRVLPGTVPAMGDRLLDEAGAALVRQPPHESVEDWLWRRGNGLARSYADELETEGPASRPRYRLLAPRNGREVAAEAPDRARARERWTAREPVLASLAAALGIPEGAADEPPVPADEALVTVLAAVNGALTELAAVRQRRRVEDAAFDNVWRGF